MNFFVSLFMYCTNRFEIYTWRNFNYGFVRVAGEDIFIGIIDSDSYFIRLDTYIGYVLRNISIYVFLINCPLVAGCGYYLFKNQVISSRIFIHILFI